MSILSQELSLDPVGIGYANMSDAEVAASLNTENRSAVVTAVSGSDVLNATDDAEFAVLSAEQKAEWLSLCAVDSIDVSNGVAKALEAALFGSGTTTRSNLQSLKTRLVSRANEIGLGLVREGDVTRARL